MSAVWSLTEGKRTWRLRGPTSEIDPKLTKSSARSWLTVPLVCSGRSLDPGAQMLRRNFMILASGVAMYPFAALAQRTKPPIVGFLGTGSSKSDAFRAEAVARGLKETGFDEGRNVIFELRWAEDHTERLPALAAELVNLGAAAIVAI